jgi:MFS family permease
MMFQPLYGQTANIFGRRRLMIVAVSLFMAGSAIGGAAQSMGVLITGRAVQVCSIYTHGRFLRYSDT